MDKEFYKSIGDRIRSARENLSLSQDQLAKRMGYTSPATISHFESGTRRISIADLKRLSHVLGVPFEYFISDTGEPSLQYFRLRASAVRPSAREAVASFLSFAEKNGSEPKGLSSDLRNLQPGKAAYKVLEYSGVKEPPVSPSEVAKALRVPVFQWDFPDEVSGIFVLENGRACIGVNQNHPYVRQRFSVAHELGHFVFHEEKALFVDFAEIQDIATISLDDDEQRRETQANQFAADLLMPMRWIFADFEEYGEENVSLMSQRYGVSEQALWFRLISLKLVRSS